MGAIAKRREIIIIKKKKEKGTKTVLPEVDKRNTILKKAVLSLYFCPSYYYCVYHYRLWCGYPSTVLLTVSCSSLLPLMSGSSANPWAFYGLPPFFTIQPAPGTLERQLSLWHNILLDHAIFYASAEQNAQGNTSGGSSCPMVRVYNENSDVFYHPGLKRRVPPSGARTILQSFATQHPNVAVVTCPGTDKSAATFEVLVATNKGGLRELEQSVLNWVLDMGEGTTTAMLSKKGAVITFDELVEGHAMWYGRKANTPWIAERLTSTNPLPCKDTGAVPEEQALRLLFKAQSYRAPGSPFQPFAVTLFNLDGSDEEPYQGLKLGGRA